MTHDIGPHCEKKKLLELHVQLDPENAAGEDRKLTPQTRLAHQITLATLNMSGSACPRPVGPARTVRKPPASSTPLELMASGKVNMRAGRTIYRGLNNYQYCLEGS